MKRAYLILLCVLFCYSNTVMAKDYIIYSIRHDVPMNKNVNNFKNYFINMGENQGLRSGTILDVYRNISTSNPYDNQSIINFKVKIGELKVIHSENGSSITKIKDFSYQSQELSLEVADFMIGDHVTVKTKN